MFGERSFRHLPCAALLLLAFRVEAAPLTLDDAMAWAINHNPRMAAAEARVARAEAGVAQAGAGREPAVSFRASGRLQGPVPKLHVRVPIGGVPVEAVTVRAGRADTANVGVGVTWPLWTGGRVEAALGAARAQVEAAEADLQQAAEQLLYEVGAVYYNVLSARSARTAAAAALKRAQEDLRTARASREAGVLTGAMVSASEAAQQQAQQALAAAESAARDAEQGLNQLLARGLGDPVELAAEQVTIETPEEPGQALAVALGMRPELLALDRRRDAAEAAIAQARAERQPTVSATAQAAWQTKTPFSPSSVESLGLEFAWPILSYAGPRAREEAARASVREAEETASDLKSAIALQVETSARRVADGRERLAAAQEAARAAEASAREAQVACEAGAATKQQLIAAQSSLEEARARHAQAEAALTVARLARARALGLMRALFLAPPEKAGQR
jgi:outer membrane protein TolC